MPDPVPAVTVVVATKDRPEMLGQCLAAIAGGDFADFEVLVVDQSRGPETRRLLQDRFVQDPRFRYLHSDVVGSSHARNVGIAKGRGPLVVFVDDDAIPVRSWLSSYVAAFRDIRPEPGMVGGKITLSWDGPCPRWYPEACKYILGTYDAGDEVREFPPGDLPISANFAIRRSALPADEAFATDLGFRPGAGGLLASEDSYLALRILSAGARLYYHPGAHVLHQVRAHKLSRTYFLRRFYWHGRAVVKLRARPGGESRGWLRMWSDRRLKQRGAGTPPAGPSQGLDARLMLLASRVAFVTGAVLESLAGERRAVA